MCICLPVNAAVAGCRMANDDKSNNQDLFCENIVVCACAYGFAVR